MTRGCNAPPILLSERKYLDINLLFLSLSN